MNNPFVKFILPDGSSTTISLDDLGWVKESGRGTSPYSIYITFKYDNAINITLQNTNSEIQDTIYNRVISTLMLLSGDPEKANISVLGVQIFKTNYYYIVDVDDLVNYDGIKEPIYNGTSDVPWIKIHHVFDNEDEKEDSNED